jgi:hypothetical protein
VKDRSAIWALFGFGFCIYLLFFAPHLRFDSLVYIEVARSITFDQDINTYNEDFYFTQPGWSGVDNRDPGKPPRTILSYMSAPVYTAKQYRFGIFPIGNTMLWLPAFCIAKSVFNHFPSLTQQYMDTGYSFPYLIVLAWWNLMIWMMGLRVAYALMRRFFSPSETLYAVIAVMGAGNLIPFVFVDICFSHCIDFLLFTAIIEIWLRTRDSKHYADYCLWGLLSGYIAIVRYQEVALLLLPIIQMAIDFCSPSVSTGKKGIRSATAKEYLTFWVSFGFIAGCQCVYWKVLHGQFIISSQKMGAANLPSFDLSNPQLIPMFFSDYHGLFSWMPFLALAAIGAILFVKENRQIGLPVLAVFLVESYYNACRTEWWNLGFGVRRFSGMSIVFILGAGYIISKCSNRWKRGLVYGITSVLVIWNILFMIQFYQFQFHGDKNSAYTDIVNDQGPYRSPEYQYVGPGINSLKNVLNGTRNWCREESLLLAGLKDVFYKPTSGKIVRICNYVLLFCLAWMFVAICSHRYIKWMVRRRILLSFIVLFSGVTHIGLWLMDSGTELIRYPVIENEVLTGKVSEIRVKKGAVFWGENNRIPWPSEDHILEITLPAHIRKISLLLLDGDVSIQGVNYNPISSVTVDADPDGVLEMRLTDLWRIFCQPVKGQYGFQFIDENLCIVEIPVSNHQSVSVLRLTGSQLEILPEICSIWFE